MSQAILALIKVFLLLLLVIKVLVNKSCFCFYFICFCSKVYLENNLGKKKKIIRERENALGSRPNPSFPLPQLAPFPLAQPIFPIPAQLTPARPPKARPSSHPLLSVTDSWVPPSSLTATRDPRDSAPLFFLSS